MNKILVATDFSRSAENALEYALHLFSLENSRLEVTLLNVCQVPFEPESTLVDTGSMLAEQSEIRLKELIDTYKSKLRWENVTFKQLTKVGYVNFLIPEVVQKLQPNYLILGAKGLSGLEKLLIGSTTAAMAKKVPCPVLVVPENINWEPLKKIVFASDYQTSNEITLLPLIDIARIHRAEISVVNICQKELVPSAEEAAVGVQLDHYLDGIPHTFHHSSDDSIIRGIKEQVKLSNAQMIAVISRKHSILEYISHASISKKMAMSPDVPVLVLHNE